MNTRTGGLALLGILIAVVAVFAVYTNTQKSVSIEQPATSTPVTVPVATTTPVTTTGYQTGDTVTVTAHIGQTVSILDDTITPKTVVDDSRCPTDVQCIWAGTVHVKVVLSTTTTVFELGKPVTVGKNVITLESVSPAKNSKQETAPGDYVFTFMVVRK